MRIDVTQDQAKEMFSKQLELFINKLQRAKALFDEGKFKESYGNFPYDEVNTVGSNLETFVDNLE